MAALYTQLLHALDINDLTPSSAIIEKLWTWASTDLNRGHFGGIVIPTLFKIRIGQYGINIISSRFRYVIQSLERTRAHTSQPTDSESGQYHSTTLLGFNLHASNRW